MRSKLAVEGVMAYRPERVGWSWLNQRLLDYAELTKLKLSLLVLFSALVGFFMGVQGVVSIGVLLAFGLGNLLLITGANALNQVMEREYDALMSRTADRPLPAKRMGVKEALIAALLLSTSGWLLLTFAVNGLTGALAALALGLYVLVYTPMKRKSIWCTVFGAISGAIPPMMGWTAAQNEIGAMAWVLFGILFFWQFPHFWAIAWMYREDYAGAGYRMLPVVDPTGARTGRQVVLFSVVLIAVSLLPAFLARERLVYPVGALGLGFIMLGCSIRLWTLRSPTAARQLMLASVIYLPALLILMLIAKK